MTRLLGETVAVLLVGLALAGATAAPDAQRRAVFLGAAPEPGGGETTCEGLDTTPERIEQDTAVRLHGAANVLFVDARTSEDFAVGRITGAVSLPWSETLTVPEFMLSKFQGCKTVVAYCDRDGCADSERLAEHLLALGVRQVRVLDGGWPDWYAAGLPVTVGAPVGEGTAP